MKAEGGSLKYGKTAERVAEAGRVGNGPLGCAAGCPPLQTSAITDQPFTHPHTGGPGGLPRTERYGARVAS